MTPQRCHGSSLGSLSEEEQSHACVMWHGHTRSHVCLCGHTWRNRRKYPLA